MHSNKSNGTWAQWIAGGDEKEAIGGPNRPILGRLAAMPENEGSKKMSGASTGRGLTN